MTVSIRLFAMFREALKTDSIELDLGELATADVSGVWAYVVSKAPQFDGKSRFVRFAVNHTFVDVDHVLHDGDEIALIPPVSGGAGTAPFHVQEEPLQVSTVVDVVRRPEAGAVVTFEGVVRNHTADRIVDHLEYEVYPEMALKTLEKIAHEIVDKFENVRAAIHHRYGRVEIGEASVVIAVSSPHRADAFSACSMIIERLKEDVPIWKKEFSPNGDVWVGWGS